jgi:delta-aminolevulinic acid dehydratase/porphobilinogen synthase
VKFVEVNLIVCHSDDMEHVPSMPGVHKLLVGTCTHIANEQAVTGLNVAKLLLFQYSKWDYHF